MSLLGSRSSSNILIKKRIQTGKEISKTKNQSTTHSRKQTFSSYLYPDILANQAHPLNRFPKTSFILPTTASAAKELNSV